MLANQSLVARNIATYEASPPRLRGRHVRLIPVRPPHWEFLYDLLLEADVGFRYTFHGSTPTPEAFLAGLEEDVFEQYVVEWEATGRPLAIVRAINANITVGRCFVSLAAERRVRGSGYALEGIAIFLDRLFTEWSFRKVYTEICSFNLPQFHGIRRFMTEEACLRRARYYAGEYWDSGVYSITAEAWSELREPFLRSMTDGWRKDRFDQATVHAGAESVGGLQSNRV